jgi:hypothetical protein
MDLSVIDNNQIFVSHIVNGLFSNDDMKIPVLTVIDTGLKLMQDRYHQAMISVTLYADAALIPSTSSRLGSQHHIFMSSFENNPFTICDTNI